MLLYVAGPYRPYGDRTTAQNITQARAIAIQLWRAGHVVICPHLNTANFEEDSGLPDERFLVGDLDILYRCDGLVMTPDWQQSQGATAEYEFAQTLKLPTWVFPKIPPKDQGKHRKLSKEMKRDPDTGAIALCAVRYCMGRRTYMPSLVQEWVKRHWSELSDQDKALIMRDVQEALQRPETLGDECDLKNWQNFDAWMSIPF